ncbi:unnamed protein product [Phaedon cochleariae]|uniref:Uncharacterized protein n=1 Tax=Phaedon cochleariae TaxID=80249 RepID=A0A9N9SKT2_PHACE|nr:unnamed protein product [Phaedon cochleariae]
MKDEKVQDLIEEVKKLTNESQEKDIFINRLRRRTKDFEAEVVEAEEQYERKQKIQNDLVETLNKKVVEISSQKDILERNLESRNSDLKKFEQDLMELNEINRSMLTSIAVLEKENQFFKNKLIEYQTDHQVEKKYNKEASSENIEGKSTNLPKELNEKKKRSKCTMHQGTRTQQISQIDHSKNLKDKKSKSTEINGFEVHIVESDSINSSDSETSCEKKVNQNRCQLPEEPEEEHTSNVYSEGNELRVEHNYDKIQDSLLIESPIVMSRILILGDEYAEGFSNVMTRFIVLNKLKMLAKMLSDIE